MITTYHPSLENDDFKMESLENDDFKMESLEK